MNFKDLGDPANGTPLFTLPGRQVAGNIVRVINNSSSQLQFFFPGNVLQIRVPSRSIRRIQLTAPETRQVTWSVISVDPTFVGTSDTVIEVYAPDECDHPFEQASAIGGGGGSVSSVAQNLGTVYHWAVDGTPTDPGGIGPFGYILLHFFAPSAGIFTVWLTLVIEDTNTGANGDLVTINTQVGNDFANGVLPGSYWQFYQGGSTTIFQASGLMAFPGSFAGNPYYSQLYPFGQVKNDEVIIGLSLASHSPGNYPSPPVIQVYGAATMLSAG